MSYKKKIDFWVFLSKFDLWISIFFFSKMHPVKEERPSFPLICMHLCRSICSKVRNRRSENKCLKQRERNHKSNNFCPVKKKIKTWLKLFYN